MKGRGGVKGRPLPSLYVVKVVLYFKDEETDSKSKGPRASKSGDGAHLQTFGFQVPCSSSAPH